MVGLINRIAILGDGSLALSMAERLKGEGFEPVLIGLRNEGMESYPDYRPEGLIGGPGDFSLCLKRELEYLELKVGLVILCYDPRWEVVLRPGFPRGKGLKEFSNTVPGRDWLSKVAFIDPTDGELLPDRFALLFDILLSKGFKPGTVHIFTPQLKISAPDLEAQYGLLREKGAVFYKSNDLRIQGSGPYIITVEDPILRSETSIEVDEVVYLEAIFTPHGLKDLLQALGLETDQGGVPQADNVLRGPYLTNRKGVLVISPIPPFTSVQDLEAMKEGAVGEIKALVQWLRKTEPKDPVAYDMGSCAYCLTCLRVCPHGAIVFTTRPNFLAFACESCGTCVSNCPGLALTLDRTKESQLFDRALGYLKSGKDRFILTCERSGEGFIASITGLDNGFLKGYAVIELPCGGSLSENLILRLLAQKETKEVLVIACKEGNCKSGTGYLYAEKVVKRINSTLKSLGIQDKSLGFVRASSQDQPGFLNWVREKYTTR